MQTLALARKKLVGLLACARPAERRHNVWWCRFRLLRCQCFLVSPAVGTQSPKAVKCFDESFTEMFQMYKEMVNNTPEFRALCDEEHVTIEEVLSSKFTPDHGWTVLGGLNLLANQTRLLGKMLWYFLCAPHGSFFVTSDDPVCCWAPADKRGLWGTVGPDNTHVEITFPLSRGVCAFASWQHTPSVLYETLQAKAVDAINLRTVLNGFRYVFGPRHDAEIQSLNLKLANEPSQTF